MAPMPYRKFKKLVESYGCTIERDGSHGRVKKGDKTVSSFGITHGTRTKGEEVKPAYVKQFLKNIK